MVGLRELAESDLVVTLEGDFAENIDLIGPGGVKYENIPAQVLREHVEETDNGPVIIDKPIVSVRMSTLAEIPEFDEKWLVSIPKSPVAGAEKIKFLLEQPPKENNSIGFVRLYLTKAVQE